MDDKANKDDFFQEIRHLQQVVGDDAESSLECKMMRLDDIDQTENEGSDAKVGQRRPREDSGKVT